MDLRPNRLKQIAYITREQREAIRGFGARTMWPAGFTVYDRGAPADGVFVVLRGQVALRSEPGSGRPFIPWIASTGETFGGEGLDPNARYATAARAEEESETLYVSTMGFSALMREQPAVAFSLLRQLMWERTQLLESFAQYATFTVEKRLIAALLRVFRQRTSSTHDGKVTRASVSRRLVSELAGATRESTSLALSRLADAGLVVRDGHSLVIIDAPGLAARLDEQDSTRAGMFRTADAVGRREA